MYFVIVTLIILVFPLAGVGIELIAQDNHQDLVEIAARWFVFWGVGVRLFLAGIVQITKPSFTAQKILGVESEESLILVRELGFANLAMGRLGLATIFVNAWVLGSALAGSIFYFFVGVNHAQQPERNAKENYAMVTDIFLGLLLAVVLFFAWQA